jgi:hypothetical protein
MKASYFLALLLLNASVQATDSRQVPTWSSDDMKFFLHGSLGTEVIPEKVLDAFRATYPEMFSDFGLIPDARSEFPVGFSRREVPHLAGLPSLGINCASCHVTEIQSRDGQRVRVLGTTSHFDAEAFFGAVIVATFRTAAEPVSMETFLAHYFHVDVGVIEKQRSQIAAALKEPLAGGLLAVAAEELRGDDLGQTARAMLKLFHNMRFALHVPDQPPPASPPNGPGRNDPWRILSYSLLGIVTKPAPIKFGVVWNEDKRTWVHVDGNTQSPIVRNLAASLGLGAPMIGHTGIVDFAVVERQTKLSQQIRPPKYPWAIDRAAAKRGTKTYRQNCAGCHDGPANDARLYPVDTDPNRAEIFTPEIAERFNQFFTELRISGYVPPEKPLRSTQRYWAPDLAGVWARAPYLHNGSVRTMQELLAAADNRETRWHRGTRLYDAEAMGYGDQGAYVLDTTGPGNSNRGHEYGVQLSAAQKHDLIEFLKTK